MINQRQFTHEIYEEECVGNSVGKHNFNALSLETRICNLSSTYVNSNQDFIIGMNGILNQLNSIKQYGDVTRYNQMFTTVSLLSSYWNSPEFSITYPLNISSVNGLEINNPTVLTPTGQLITLAKGYLDKNFPAQSYPPNTKINVNMFVYSAASNPADPNNLVSLSQDGKFTFMDRNINVLLTRRDVHLESGNIFQFVKMNNSWTNVSVIGPQININSAGRKKVYLKIEGFKTEYNVGLELQKDINFNGYEPGNTDIVLTISSGARVTSTNPNTAALTFGNLKNGDYVILFNYGSIIGAGGDGGNGGDSADTGDSRGQVGGMGGTAIASFVQCAIENYGHIYAGGGGGAGGTGGLTGSTSVGGAGGGGAGIVGGAGGLRGNNAIFKSRGVTFSDANDGGDSEGGNGGPGLSSDPRAAGGDGGAIAQDGKDSDSASGGSAGFYIMGNNNVYWSILGDVRGKVT